jgi:hypothetical protein
MSDDVNDTERPEPDATPGEDPIARYLREVPAMSDAAPAVHGDTLWGGPQWIHNATGEPVFVETKEEYFALLNRYGLRMKDQQESTTGPEQPKAPQEVPVHLQPSPPVLPMSQDEAHVHGAMTAIFKRYGLIATVWCTHCFARNRWHGCRYRVTSRSVTLQCRCGAAQYIPPLGTTDLVLERVSNAAVTLADRTIGSVVTDFGQELRPTFLLHDMEALLIQRYAQALSKRGYEPRYHHIGCWSSDARREEDACGLKIAEKEVIVICPCRLLFWRAKGGLVQ